MKLVLALAFLLAAPAFAADSIVRFTDDEIRRILQHGPWPVAPTRDPSNRASGARAAIEAGESLFFDRRLSAKGSVSCSTCHDSEHHWTDGERTARALGKLDRNTPQLVNVRLNRWFGWDGASDSLWSQIIRPIVDPRELGSDARHVARVVREDELVACRYERALGTKPAAQTDEQVLVGAAKMIAAFLETLASDRTPFDDFRDALERGDSAAIERYNPAAKRGLKLFLGRGNCAVCHSGPNFTNGEFHDTGIKYFVAPGKVDSGRYAGIKSVTGSRFNLLGSYNDDPSRAPATATRHVALEPRNWGEFRVPSLRHAAFTAPYMHNGSLDSLRDVVRHYSEIPLERLHGDGERILQPLNLSARETDDLIVFLESLTNFRPGPWRAQPQLERCK